VEDLALVPVDANLLALVVGVPVERLPEPVFPVNGTWIAASCLSSDLPLLTLNLLR